MNKILLMIVIFSTTIVYSQNNYFVNQNGSVDFTTIEEVNAANLQPGDIVSFKSGQRFDDAALICKKRVTYNTYGGAVKAILGNPNGKFEKTIEVNTDNVTIDNLKIIGNDYAYYIIGFSGKNLIIENCEIVGGNNAHKRATTGIRQTNLDISAKNLTIKNNVIHDIGYGIYISKPLNVDIAYNKIYDLYTTYSILNGGGYAIRASGTQDGDTWNCNYTFNVNHNEVYNFEYAVFAMGLSKMIIEYNIIHNNLDERIYRGGTKHGSVGKLFDNTDRTIGGIGLIFRYNYVHDLKRYGEPGYTYSYQTEEQILSGTFKTLNSNNGTIYSWYQIPEDNSYRQIFGEFFGDQIRADGTISGENPDAVISGLGYSNVFVHNNIFENCTNSIFTRGYSRKNGSTISFRQDLGSYFVNNNIINCGTQTQSVDYSPIIFTDGDSQSPHTQVNNIFEIPMNSVRSVGKYIETELYLDYNIYINHSGYSTKSPNLGSGTATYISDANNNSAGNSNSKSGLHEKYLTNPHWVNPNSILYVSDIGVNGVNLPDLRIRKNGNSSDAGLSFNLIGDSYSGHKIGQDPTGRSFAYDILGNLRTTNDIGALGTYEGSNIDDTQTNSSIIITNQTTTISTNLGENINLQVSATCEDPIGYQWWRYPFVSEEESKIINDNKFSGANSHILTINNVSADDIEKQYLCEVYKIQDYSNSWLNSNPISISLNLNSEPTSENYLKVYLEGPYLNGTMQPIIESGNIFPNLQPYKSQPWNLDDNTTITEFQSEYIDWIIVELRKELKSIIYRKPAIITKNGMIINFDGSKFSFSNISDDKYYISIIHRNHLGIISQEKININANEPINFDFTDSQSKVQGTNSLAELGNGKFGMFSGDADANGIINNLDFGSVANNILKKGYYNNDLDMNGIVNVLDYNKINKNILKSSFLIK